MSFKNSLRDRALKTWAKQVGLNSALVKLADVIIYKSRSKKTITVKDREYMDYPVTWSYKNGGKLEKVA